MDDVDSDDSDEEELAKSGNSRKIAPFTCTSTITSCTSTQAEPSTSIGGLDNTCPRDTGTATTTPAQATEAQTDQGGHQADEIKVVQGKVTLTQSTATEKDESDDSSSSGDQDTQKDSGEKVCKMNQPVVLSVGLSVVLKRTVGDSD